MRNKLIKMRWTTGGNKNKRRDMGKRRVTEKEEMEKGRQGRRI